MSTVILRIVAIVALVAGLGLVGYQAARGKMGVARYAVDGVGKDAKLTAPTNRVFNERRDAILSDPSLDADAKKQQVAALDKSAPVSFSRTFGLWLSALFTLAILSFLYKDNPLYKIAEHTYVGVSAAYGMVMVFWEGVVPLLFTKLAPYPTKIFFMPSLNLDNIVEELSIKSWLRGFVPYEDAVGTALGAHWYQLMDFWYIVPTILGLMLVWRLSPKGGWISRWPISFIIGATAGMKLIAYLSSDFVKQIDAASSKSLIALRYYQAGDMMGQLDWNATLRDSMNSIILLIGTICVLIYFFFSLEHKGFVGKLSKIGIWTLMITFGASFGYTVMGRIALLGARFEFLVWEWLNLTQL